MATRKKSPLKFRMHPDYYEYLIYSYEDDGEELIIPAEFKGYPVIGFHKHFNNCDNIEHLNVTSLFIPNTFKSLDFTILRNFPNLKRINSDEDGVFNVPEGVKNLNLTWLPNNIKKLVIHKNVEEICESLECNLEYISVDPENPIFNSENDCNAVIETATNRVVLYSKNTVISEKIEELNLHHFCNVKCLKSIYIHKNVKSLGFIPGRRLCDIETIEVDKENPYFDSRNDCNAIIDTKTNTLLCGCKNTIIPEGIENLGTYAFSNVQAEDFKLPNSLKCIGRYAFTETKLKKLYIPDSVTEIKMGAFEWSRIEEIRLPLGLNELSENALGCCKYLRHLDIPSSVTKISDYALDGLDSVKYLFIPKSVTYVGRLGLFIKYELRQSITLYLEEDHIPETWSSDWYGDGKMNLNIKFGYKKEDIETDA